MKAKMIAVYENSKASEVRHVWYNIFYCRNNYYSVYDNYREFEISVLPLSHLKLKGLGQ